MPRGGAKIPAQREWDHAQGVIRNELPHDALRAKRSKAVLLVLAWTCKLQNKQSR
jgi:hypothetical protein